MSNAESTKCCVCKGILRNPLQTGCCGNRICTECITVGNKSGVCPIARCVLPNDGRMILHHDKAAEKEMRENEKRCSLETVTCKKCDLILPSADIKEQHSCQKTFSHDVSFNGMTFKEAQEHQSNCDYVTTDSVKVLLKKIDEHNKKDCIKRKVSCRFCGVQMLFENTQSNHEDIHNVYVVCEIKKLKTENEHLKKTVDKQKDLIESLLLDKQTYLMKNEENDKIIQGLLKPTAGISCDSLSEQLQYQEARVVHSGDRFDSVDTKLASIGGTNSALDSQAVTNCVVKVEQLENSYTLLSKNVSDLRQQLLENTNYGRRYIWKVDNIQHRTNQAIIGRITALHSAPCFTEKFGYKYCARLYLNGDGIGKSTHLSLFFVVMKSEYDELLNWPFTERITFILRDLDNPSRSIKESFLPDMNPSSFKRPVRDMNVAAGCPMFVSLETLRSGNFIRDNAMFIEIEIGDHKK